MAFHVRDHPTQQTANPIAPRQKYERVFSVSPSAADKVAPVIDHLIIAAPGVTVVSFDADADAATVKVSSDVPEAVELFEVLEHGGCGVEIRVKANREHRHYILTEVSLPTAYALRLLDVRGSGTVVVEDRVLPTNDPQADVSIRVTGSGDVFANSHSDVLLKSLTLDLAGSGDVQFIARAVNAREKFATNMASSGDICVFTGSITAPQIKMSTAGSGRLRLAALRIEALGELVASLSGSGKIVTIGESLQGDLVSISIAGSGDINLITTTEFVANSVKASVAGSGTVSVASASARCAHGDVSVAGSGTVDLRDLVAHQAKISVSGSGSALIGVSEAAETVVAGSGRATIVGQVPPRVIGRPVFKTEEEKPSKLERLACKRRTPLSIPTKLDAFEHLAPFHGTLNVRSCSDFVTAVKMLWNHRSGDKIDIKAGNCDDEDDSACRP